MRLFSSDCAIFSKSCIVSAVMISVVSSAYVYTFESSTVCIILFMYSRKKVVDRVLPWGIPCVLDFACCVCSDWWRFWKYDLK